MQALIKHKEKAPILIIDDEPANVLALEAVLQNLGQPIVRAYTGKEALKKILEYDFAVILMDAYMPEYDGFETACLIRMRDKSRYTPIIFLSALYQKEIDIAQGYAMGAVDYIFKPIDPAILRSKVQVFINLFTKSIHAQMLQVELKKRVCAEKALKQLAYQTQSILTSAGEGIYGLDTNGIITFANPAAATILGMTVDELISQPVHCMLNPTPLNNDNRDAWKQNPIFLALQNNEVYHNDDGIFLKKDGSTIPVEYTISPKKGKRLTKFYGAVVVFKDISSRKRAEELACQHQHQLEIAHKARLSTMEEMASALAHELNQPLSAIANYGRGCIRRLQTEPLDTAELLYATNEIARLAERAGQVIHRIKNFIRKSNLNYKRININKLIVKMDKLINYELMNTAVIIYYNLSDVALWTMVDKVQIEQVILNLLRNGVEAMSQ